MTECDKPKFAALLTALAALFGQALDKPLLSAYWQFLSDMPMEALQKAVGASGRTLKWFPKAAELRELGGAGTKAKALHAWDVVRKAMRKHGYVYSVDFGPLVNAVVRNMGGWLHLDNLPTDELNVWGKKEFERVYELLASKDAGALNGDYLRGEFGGTPVLVPIADEAPPRGMLEKSPISDMVRELAEGKT